MILRAVSCLLTLVGLVLLLAAAAPGTATATGTAVPEAPRNLRVSPGESGDLVVSWKAPASDGGSAVSSYKVQWKSGSEDYDGAPESTRQTAVADLDRLTHTISDLKDGKKYTVRVIATNDAGDSVPSAEANSTPRPTPELEDQSADPKDDSGEDGVYTWRDGDRVIPVRIETKGTEPEKTDRRSDVEGDSDYRTESIVSVSVGGDTMSLPGGVLVVLNPSWSKSRTDAFFSKNGVAPGSVSRLQSMNNTFVVETAPGLPSLHLANALATQDGVRVVSPNWQMEVAAQQTPEQDDHGDTPDTATDLPLNTPVAGVISSDADDDYFRFELTQSTFIVVRDFDSSKGATWFFEIYDDEGNSLFTSFGAGVRLPVGTYYVRVSWDYILGRRSDYNVQVKTIDDHGDTIDSATPLDIRPLTYVSQLFADFHSPDDVDYFEIEVDKPSWIIMDSSGRTVHNWHGQNFIGVNLDLFDSDGNALRPPIKGLAFEGRPYWLEVGTYYARFSPYIHRLSSGDVSPFYIAPYNVYLFQDTDYTEFIDECSAIQTSFSDPLFGCQWHLDNTPANSGTAGQDINVDSAWTTTRGEGVNVVIVDDEISFGHEDLEDNRDPNLGYNYVQLEEDIDPRKSHGLAVAGIIAARDNNLGGRGVAPRATIFGYNFTQNGTLVNAVDAFTRNSPVTAVSNNSWAVGNTRGTKALSQAWVEALETGVNEGFHGKGTFYAFAAGNSHPHGFHVNLNEGKNHYTQTLVCAVTQDGTRDELSETGYSLWLCAPRAHFRTDHWDRYTNDFGGTSAATAVVSGVAALLRSANPDLTWRDLKLILAGSARNSDPANRGWEAGALKYGSDTDRYSYNPEYGFGVVDAGAAVELAKNWTKVPPMRTAEVRKAEVQRAIPDPASGSVLSSISSRIELETDIAFTEFVEARIDVNHPAFRDIGIELISPSGAISKLAVPDDVAPDEELTMKFRLGSARHLGEDPNGTWTLRVTDHYASEKGTFSGWELTVYGHSAVPVRPRIMSLTSGSGQLEVSWAAPHGLPPNSYKVQWKEASGNWDAPGDVFEQVIASVLPSSFTITSLTDGVQYSVRVIASNGVGDSAPSVELAGSPGSNPPAGRPTITGFLYVGETLTADTSEIADANGLNNVQYEYQWLADDTIITGATGSTYTLTNSEEGSAIKVRVSFTDDGGNDETLTSAAAAAVRARLTTPPDKPDAPTGSLDGVGNASLNWNDVEKATSYQVGLWWNNSWTKLPNTSVNTGLSISGSHATVTGLPTTAKVYRFRVRALNSVGTSDWSPSSDVTLNETTLNSLAMGLPSITGTVRVDETLTADTTDIADPDGLANPAFTYQWLADNSAIAGATASTYTLADDDEGKAIKVRVSFTDDRGNDETLTSTATDTVAARPNSPATGAPTLIGKAQVGEMLTVDTTGIADPDGMENARFVYTWFATDGDLERRLGFNGSSYPTHVVWPRTKGMAIIAKVRFTDDAGNDQELTSAATDTVLPAPRGLDGTPENPPWTPFDFDYEVIFRGGVDLYWDDVVTAESYDVELYLDRQTVFLPGEGVDIAFYGAGAIITGLDHGSDNNWVYSIVSFRVRANNPRGSSDWSAWRAMPFFGFPIMVNHNQPANSTATGAPAVSGKAEVGETLTADVAGITDDDGLNRVKFYYQWVSGEAATEQDIDDATKTEYTVTDTDKDKAIRVRVNFTDRMGYAETLTSAATDVVSGAPSTNNAPTGAPTISGTAQVGETLTTDTSGIEDADGLFNARFSYQWLSSRDTKIGGATSSTYTLQASDASKIVRVRVSFTDDTGNDETLTSAATDAVTAATQPNTPATGAPTTSGTVQVGETLTANTSGVADDDGLSKVQYEYQWLADDTAIQDATGSTYTLVEADEGKPIKVQVNFNDDAGNEETLKSTATAAVTAAPTPNTPATGTPTISGTAQLGEMLTVDTSGISDPDGLTTATLSYQWLADEAAIVGATANTYTLADADESKAIKVQVSFTDDAGNDEMLTSAATDAVAAAPPENTEATGAPTINGTAQVGETLTADTSRISDAEGLNSVSYSYQWIQNDGNSDSVISGATASTYTLAYADEGKAIKVQVSFTDDARNEETLTSAATDAVAATPNSPATGAPTISGTAQVGRTLTADTSGISDADGLTSVSYSYHWLAGDSDISGATGSTYTLADADEGKAIKVQVSFTDDGGNDETLSSAGTEAVAGNKVPVASEDVAAWSAIMTVEWVHQGYGYYSTDAKRAGSLSPASFEVDGMTYTVRMVETQGWWMYIGTDRELSFDFVLELDGVRFASNDASFSSYSYGNIYRWQGAGLSLRDGDAVEIRLLRAFEDETAVNSTATGAPIVSGMAQVGETLTADTSGIADADGLDNAAFTYQWLAGDTDISGATGSTYTLADAEAGKTVKVQVSFTDDAGHDETLTSTATATVEAPPNNPATGTPTISGTAQVGETLTADTSGISDADGLTSVTYSYQWLGDDAAIAGATGSTYTLADADEGKTVKVQVSFTDDAANGETRTSEATDAVATATQPNNPATGAPTISGTAQVGETLTANTSGIADEDGLDNAAFTYQWLADNTANSGATGSTYTLVAADEGKAVTVQVSFTDDGGNDETLTSAATDAVVAATQPNTPATGAPTISGTARVGETLTADTLGISDADGLTNATLSYQWLADDADISGATGSTYTLTDSDEGKTVEVRVSFTDDAGHDEALTSTATDPVAAAPAPNTPATGAPTISGTARVGETLTADTLGIADVDGLSGATFSYQWVANDGNSDTDITGATDSTYTLVAADEGKAVTVQVSFTDDAGNDETLTSAATDAVAEEESVAREDVVAWSAIMTVEWVYQGYGYYSTDAKKAGSLSPASFEVDGMTYTVKMVETQGWWMYIGVDRELPFDFVLELDGVRVASSDASFSSYSYGNIYRWEGTGLSLRDEDAVEIRLLRAFEAETAVNSAATGAPVISGTAQVGETLTADTSGIADADGLDNAVFVYQWLADDTEVAGATGSTHTLVEADQGKAVKVRVSFTDGADNEESLTSAATPAVAARPNNLATGAPTISGTAQVGETLRADTSVIADPDGLDDVSFSYQWLADGTDISRATGSTYTLVEADEGKAVKVRVSFTDDGGNDETLTSAATGAVDARPNNPATGAPTISGTAQVGETLTVDTSDIADVDGLNNVAFNYQWLGDDGEITGATSSTYTLADADEGKAVKVRVSFTDDAGNDETLTSAAMAAVAAPEPPARPTGLTAEVSHDSVTLTWDDPNDDSVTGYAILRRDKDIHEEGTFETVDSDTGSAGTTYTDDTVEPEKQYVYRIKAINADGLSEISSWVRADTPAAPTPEPPAAPTGLTAEVSHNTVTLLWDDPQDDGITGYVILRRNRATDAQGQFTGLVPDTGTAATTYTDATVAAETPYTYRIQAINEHGTSERSRWVHVETTAAPAPEGTPDEGTPEQSVSEGDTDLPNDNSTPGRVAVGGSATGAIGTAGDQDRFAVELEAGRTYQFDLTGSPGGGGTLPDTFFRAIYNSEGQYQPDSYNDDFEGSRDSRVTFTPTESGTYYARVSGDRDETGSYTLSVQ